MARPRIFISSTFYDLRHVRADIDAFISDLGYDAVANERGDIAYGSEQALEEYCYKEIENSDVVVSIIGGRFGSESRAERKSISQMEVATAVKLGRQLYVFVDAEVWAELRTYKLNKNNKDVKYAHADDPRIFEFLEEIERLKSNNTIFPFSESSDIVEILREQWAGLFQRLLRTASRQEEVRVIDSLKATAQSLEDLMKYAKNQTQQDDGIVSQILLPSHPIFQRVAELLGVKYRVYFQNLDELRRWLKQRGFGESSRTSKTHYVFEKEVSRYGRANDGTRERQIAVDRLLISKQLFSSSGDLKVMSASGWKDGLLELETEVTPAPAISTIDLDDEIPF